MECSTDTLHNFNVSQKKPLWPELQTLQTKQNAFKPSTSILQFLLHLPPILRGPHAKELLDAGNQVIVGCFCGVHYGKCKGKEKEIR